MSSALDTLVAERRRFEAFLTRRLGDGDEAADLLQDALLKALRTPPADDDPEGVVRWFYRVLRNALIDRARHHAVRDRALARVQHEPAAEEDAELWDATCECMRGLIGALPPDQAEVLRAVDLEERPVVEVAAAAGISAGNGRVRLHRARTALRTRIEEFCRTCAGHGCLDCTCGSRSAERDAQD